MCRNYENYHKHTRYSSTFLPDSCADMESYFKRAKELGHTRYYTTEHGYNGSIFEALSLQEKYGIKVIQSMEIYIVKDNDLKDKSNYHMILIAKNNKARRVMNLLNSNANQSGFYYRPRWSLSDVLSLNPSDFYVTSACVAGIAKNEESTSELAIPIAEHFGENFYWEVQNHEQEIQKNHNLRMLELAKKYGGGIVHANDSHYVYPEDHETKVSFLKGKGVSYDDEDSFILDYPSYDQIFERYKKQGILSDSEIIISLENTLKFDSEEHIDIDKTLKMPTILPDLSAKDRYFELAKIITEEWNKEKHKIPESLHGKYLDAIKFEMDIVKETNEVAYTADYFYLNHSIVTNAIDKYGGVLTKTGRGSAPSFYINKLLGMTSVDRLALDVPILPTRFISKSRVISGSTPDIDYNVKDPEPFMKSTREFMGEHGAHWMLAYGTMQESEAFRNICRDRDIPYDEFNPVAKDLDSYRNDKKWNPIIEKSKKLVGSIVSVSRHPCAVLLLNGDIREEIGLIRSGKDMVATITSLESDTWKYLKNDYLTVTVVGIIYDTFKRAGLEVPDVSELMEIVDSKTWEIYRNGITATLNQASTLNGTRLVKQYAPENYVEMSSFVAIIRPACATLLQDFLNRIPYDNGVDELNKLLSTTDNRILYQESIMAFLVWLGIPEDETYTILKKIAKKVYHLPENQESFKKLHDKLTSGWLEKVGNLDDFDKAWQIIEDAVKYLFNASHSVCTAFDSIYGAYLKAHHTFEYYEDVLNKYESDIEMSHRLIDELKYFDISLKSAKFRYSDGHYRSDKNNRIIYKGIGSIKTLNSDIGDVLYEMKDSQFDSFFDFLEQSPLNKTQTETLIKVDFFSEFGKAKKLLDFYNVYRDWRNKKTVKKDKLDKFPFNIKDLYNNSKETDKQFSKIDFEPILRNYFYELDDIDFKISEKAEHQKEFLGYINMNLDYPDNYCIAIDIDDKFSTKIQLQSLGSGKSFEVKIRKRQYKKKVSKFDIVIIHDISKEMGYYPPELDEKTGKKIFKKNPNKMEWILKSYEVIKEL